MTPAIQYARHLIQIAANDEEAPDYLCQIRLQKLLYYVQGWSLAVRNRQAFSEALEAWRHGPVVPEVYHAFKEYGNRPILHTLPSDLNDEEKAFTQRIWEHYRGFSSFSLMQLTHSEPPWKEQREGLRPDEESQSPLSHETMRGYFQSIDVSRIPGLEPELMAESDRQFEEGRTVSFEELLGQ